MQLTLFCDASFCAQTKASGWGAWAKCDGWTSGVFLGGQFKVEMPSSSDAEVCAVGNALLRLEAAGSLNGVATVMVQSDSMRALQLILQKGLDAGISNHHQAAEVKPVTIKNLTALEVQVHELLVGMRERTNVQLIARHVRGHTQGANRQWVNRQCDRIAKNYMNIAREKKKGKV